MTTQKISFISILADGDVRWTVVVDLPREHHGRLFCLSLLDGEEFASMRDAALAVANAVDTDSDSEDVRH